MKRSSLILGGLLAGCLCLISGCSQTQTATPLPATTTEVIATATQEPTLAPTATATELPPLPCNIVFYSDRDKNKEIYTMAPDGSQQTNVSNNPADDQEPVWSPDGTQIAFISNRPTDAGGWYVYVMNADGSNVTQVSHQPDSHAPDWSPLGSEIIYASKGDLYLVDIDKGTEVNLTNSPENDDQPKFSPDGKQIAWVRGEDNDTHVYVMALDGSNQYEVTKQGKVGDVYWSVDGRLFTHWENPDGICFNCVVTSDGKEVVDGGGKGTIQQFLPFWTVEGDRVELVSVDINGAGHEDVYLVSDKYPDVFKPLTSNNGNNRTPKAPAKCGPTHGVYPQYGTEAAAAATPAVNEPARDFTLGYTGQFTDFMQQDLDQACKELGVKCVHGDTIDALVTQKVDAIIDGSNRWDVLGSYPSLHAVIEQKIPLFMLNAELNEPGAYNLSAESEITSTTLNWMFKQMGGKGEFVYYNFGHSDYIQNIIDSTLKSYPDVQGVAKEADYNGNSFSQHDIEVLLAENPAIKAIWSTEHLADIYWAINDSKNNSLPVTECNASKDDLINWKNLMDGGSKFQCIAQIRPGGTAYEGVYVAYYYLSGMKFNPDKLVGEAGNTLKYDIPVITNETLPSWIGPNLDPMRVGENQLYQLPPMTPEQIKKTWFLE